jgi:hypothetical protein
VTTLPPPWLVATVDQAVAFARDARADAPRAEAEQRCALPPVGCGRSIAPISAHFRDQASRAEHRITGLCQACQDVLFAPCAEDEDADDPA